jgi:hypothetical protein
MNLEAFPKLQFWESNLKFMGKSGLFGRFFQEPVPKPCDFSARIWDRLPKQSILWTNRFTNVKQGGI